MNTPSAKDWYNVGYDLVEVMNDFENVMGLLLTPYPLEDRPPTDEELNEWEKTFPGSKQKLIDAAYAEMSHRLEMEKSR